MKAEDCNKIFVTVIEDYHKNDHVNSPIKNPFKKNNIHHILYEKCWIDTVQWHLEDLIRVPNINPNDGIKLKQRIDKSNQERTDIVEMIDDFYCEIYKGKEKENSKLNTESPGWVVDRLSILSLKIFHMNEQVSRKDADEEHLQKCQEKLNILLDQQVDLSNSFDDLLNDYDKGVKKIKVYRQMKMYNDANLNPSLYQKKS